MPLHGSLHGDEQDRALAESTQPARRSSRRILPKRRLTVPGVTAVVDTGLQKVARYDADRGIDSSRGRADYARTRPTSVRAAPVAWRLASSCGCGTARDRLRPHREPEIRRVDLAAAALDVIAWGGDPRQLDWIEPPPPDALEAALTLLARLELVANGALTELGDRVRRLPLHPRLARMLVAGGGCSRHRAGMRACCRSGSSFRRSKRQRRPLRPTSSRFSTRGTPPRGTCSERLRKSHALAVASGIEPADGPLGEDAVSPRDSRRLSRSRRRSAARRTHHAFGSLQAPAPC